MDVQGMLEGAAFFAGGQLFGSVTRWRTKSQPRKPPKAICGCEHALSYHDRETGECHAWHEMFGYKPSKCKCRQYTGPEPLTQYYAPEINP